MNMIFSKSLVVSQYICRRIYRYFVYYDIDANIEANVIVPLAQTFVASNWDIMPVLSQLFKSQHFFDMARDLVTAQSLLTQAGFGNERLALSGRVVELARQLADVVLFQGVGFSFGYRVDNKDSNNN